MANTKKGQVVKTGLDKTITVAVITYKTHPLYKKRYIHSKKYLVDDPQNQAKLKDRVIIRQCRPISRRKRWALDQIVTDKPAKATKMTETTKTTKTAKTTKASEVNK